jgi:site-specific recombinase XerD
VLAQPDPPAALADVRKKHIAEFLASRTGVDSPETVLSRHRRLRAFFKWAEREQIIDKNPISTLREPSVPALVPHLVDVTSNRPTGSRGFFSFGRVGGAVVNPAGFRLQANV